MALGLDNFLYEMTVDGKTANFKFWDQEDVTNTAEVSVGEKEFPGGSQSGSREVADYAYSLCSKQLNDKRDARQKKAEADRIAKQSDEEAKVREVSNNFLAEAEDGTTAPAKVEADGTTVYNTAGADTKDDKKK